MPSRPAASSHAPSCLHTVVMVPGSSTDVSEDWEKDFDLDMTEEEVQVALSKVDASGEVSARLATGVPARGFRGRGLALPSPAVPSGWTPVPLAGGR